MPPSSNAYEFFLITTPGLEDLVAQEVCEWFPELEKKVEHGGVTVHAPLARGLSMNLALKTPTRVLIRASSFTCRDFPKLFKKVSEFPWSRLVDAQSTLEVHATSHRSRLKIKKRIEETCTKAWAKRTPTPDPKLSVTLYVRINDNLCTLSLDTSGERLHKRGERTHIGEAPLRENLASALIQWTGHGADPRPVELIDPLMGSGTFLLEAAGRDRLVEARDFAFNTFKVKAIEAPVLGKTQRPLFTKLIGYEITREALKAATKNLERVDRGYDLELIQTDFFSAPSLPPPPESTQRWVICNPPYGERLKVDGPLDQYYAKLMVTVEKVARPDRACFLLSAKGAKGRLALPAGWKVIGKRPFSNGGIPVVAFLFARN